MDLFFDSDDDSDFQPPADELTLEEEKVHDSDDADVPADVPPGDELTFEEEDLPENSVPFTEEEIVVPPVGRLQLVPPMTIPQWIGPKLPVKSHLHRLVSLKMVVTRLESCIFQ